MSEQPIIPRNIADSLTELVVHQRAAREEAQREASALVIRTHLVFIEIHYTTLPLPISRRLTEIDEAAIRETMSKIKTLEGAELLAFCERVASDKAFAQAIRAANVYRQQIGEPLISPEGRLPGEELSI